MLAFDSNTAGRAGGGLYSSCFQLGKCKSVLKKTLGLPTSSGVPGNVFSFSANRAAGYGQDVATAPAELVIVNAAKHLVPGASNLNISFSLLDSEGQAIVGATDRPISHLVQMLVLPAHSACSSVESCDQFKLQATEAFFSGGEKVVTSMLHDFRAPVPLQSCQIGIDEVQVRLIIISGDELDTTGASQSENGLRQLLKLQNSVVVTCRCLCGTYIACICTYTFTNACAET